MSEMVERVARVLCVADGKDPDSLWPVAPAGEWPGKNNSKLVPLWKARYSESARLAIEAMRKPTERMMEAGGEECLGEPSCDEVWQAMIDTALSDSTQTPSKE